MQRTFAAHDRVTLKTDPTRWWLVGGSFADHSLLLLFPTSGPVGGRWARMDEIALHVRRELAADAPAPVEPPPAPERYVVPSQPWERRGVPLDALLRAGKRNGVGVHWADGEWHLPLPDEVLSGATPKAVLLKLEKLEREAERTGVGRRGALGGDALK